MTNERGSKEEYRTAQAQLMRAKEARTRADTELVKVKILKAKAETEFLKVKAEKIRLENLQYAPSVRESDRGVKLQERIDRVRSETQKIADRYGLEHDFDDEDEANLRRWQ